VYSYVEKYNECRDKLAAAEAHIAELEAERSELYQFLDVLASAGLRFNDVPLKDALRSIREIGGSKFTWPEGHPLSRSP
jgi:hypothetical protein